jgi:Putative zinc-finger
MKKELTEIQLFILEKQHIECADFDELLAEYVENELADSLHARLKAHAQHCKICKRGEMLYREVISLAKNLPKPAMPEGMSARLRAALNDQLGLELPVEE